MMCVFWGKIDDDSRGGQWYIESSMGFCMDDGDSRQITEWWLRPHFQATSLIESSFSILFPLIKLAILLWGMDCI